VFFRKGWGADVVEAMMLCQHQPWLLEVSVDGSSLSADSGHCSLYHHSEIRDVLDAVSEQRWV
jgi:hypothetical protein